ncbi:hypothetical protein NEOLEDRAFT_1069568 [Neolentinus lepideus HHB14362 ss-1]|uniref:Uncharacterized protein n=1 Tax=Neolentinus lepideus HHB14362 ss-1 TaxID=1314782 RepID=A0A165R8H3_9AGAM|nr:hypothetical protein NEOLEDRAFT_1069568 [Neolentinus lepideus HHB14362 ss-1]
MSGATDESMTFKKATQEINRPATTDHNINDEYMRDPPNNLASGDVPTTDRTSRGQKEGAYDVNPDPQGVIGEPGKGRPKKDEIMREAIQGSESDSITSS